MADSGRNAALLRRVVLHSVSPSVVVFHICLLFSASTACRNQVSAEEVVLLDMGAFCQTPGDDDADLPYTTSRMLDVKQPAGPQQPPSPKQPWWRRCRSGCRRGDNAADTETDGDLSDGSPRHSQSALPPAAQMSRPYLGSRAVTDGSNISTIPSGFARPYSAASAGGASSVRSPSISSRQQQGQVGVDSGTAAGKQQDAAVVGRLVSFSARATKQWAELRKTLTRSQSFQGPQAAMRRDWESVRLYQVLPPALAGRAHVWHNKLNLKDGWICWDNMYFEAPGGLGLEWMARSWGICALVLHHRLPAGSTCCVCCYHL